MSRELPKPGTTVILRQKKDAPYDWNYNNKKPTYNDFIVVVLRETQSEVVVQLKNQPIEAYIPRRFFLSKGSELNADPPIITIPPLFEILTLPI